ncbi:MAG: hypothetical protein KC438_05785, partial [Thermomicrobiales bacterium]|nr:hypothetical protein [Thermomicrobiales bacterium]
GCVIPDVERPDERTITLIVLSAAGYGPPEVSGTVTQVGGTVEPFSFSGAGTMSWGPDPGYAAIEVFAEYENLSTGGTEIASASGTCVPAPTPTATNTPPPTSTPSVTMTPSETGTPTETRTATNTRTATGTPTETLTPSVTATPSITRTPTSTGTATMTATITNTPTVTSTPSITLTPTITNTPANTNTATVTRTASSTRTASPTRTSTPFGAPNGSLQILCGNSTEPGAGVYSGFVFLSGPGYAVANWTLERDDGTFLYGGPATIPPTTNPIFAEEGKFVNAFLNVVYYTDEGSVFAVANATTQCDITPGNTWTPTVTQTATSEVTETATATATTAPPTNTATATATSTATNTATASATSTASNTATATATSTPTTAVPVAPDVTDGECLGGTWTAPSVDPVTTTGITYVVTQTPNAGNGWTYIVTATALPGYTFGDLTGTGWVPTGDNEATYSDTVEPNLCIETVPVAPDVTDGECLGGTWTAPSVDPVTTTGIAYVVTQMPNAGNGWTYIVTATVQPGYEWGDLTGTGWTEVNDETATYSDTVEPNLCIDIIPPTPNTIEPGTDICVGGTYLPPVIVPGTTPGLSYTVVQQPSASNSWTYIVRATIVVDGIAWGDLSGTGWIQESATVAVYVGTVDPNLCSEIIPVKPTITGNECVDGVYVPPVVVPGKTPGVTYTVVQQPSPHNRWTYIVKATIVADGIGWGDLTGTGWVRESSTVATFTTTVVPKGCDLPKPHGPHGVTVLPSTGTGSAADSMLAVSVVMVIAAMFAAASGLVLRRRQG